MPDERRIPDPAGSLAFLRPAALVALLAGAAGSLVLTLHAGRHNNSRVLVLLFAAWVLSPFLAALAADLLTKTRPVRIRAPLHVTMLVLALASLALYAYAALGNPTLKVGFFFLIVPLASWLLIAIVCVTLRFGSPPDRRR